MERVGEAVCAYQLGFQDDERGEYSSSSPPSQISSMPMALNGLVTRGRLRLSMPFESQPDRPPITRLVWRQPYACILFDRDPWENPGFTLDRETDLKKLRELPAGTMAAGTTLSANLDRTAGDFEQSGFIRLTAQLSG